MNKAICIGLIFLLFGCAGRLPQTKRAEGLINRHFHKYGKKFETSDFGAHKIKKVSVLDIQELHKKMAAALAQVELQDGPIYMVRCVLEKKSLGWRFVSWERL
ncbi:MAG: hypothetical protein HYY43_00165 [Deltaproteobacteria bacterium]|nr:hypothetical protein [Deltaproteobacteria bacterium]MBI2342498.1 hypothetical protein [Deltaproteobacteria bacterium]MBI2974001.1 hypothetical protein [Deltaproteobacteria bacterium]